MELAQLQRPLSGVWAVSGSMQASIPTQTRLWLLTNPCTICAEQHAKLVHQFDHAPAAHNSIMLGGTLQKPLPGHIET